MITNEKNIIYHQNDSHKGGSLIDNTNGGVNGFCMGLSEYFTTEFGAEGIHEDQEGFYVLEGNGMAKIGNKIFAIEKGDSFIVPANTPHVLKKDKNSVDLKVLWAHGAI